MSAPPYTKRRGNVYWFQLRVPKDLLPVYGRRLITKSLGTVEPAIAGPRALELAGRYKQEFAARRREPDPLNAPPHLSRYP